MTAVCLMTATLRMAPPHWGQTGASGLSGRQRPCGHDRHRRTRVGDGREDPGQKLQRVHRLVRIRPDPEPDPGGPGTKRRELGGGRFRVCLRLMGRVYEQLGLSFSFVDMRNPENVDKALTKSTQIVYGETPTNPMMFLADLQAIGDICQARGVVRKPDLPATPVARRRFGHAFDHQVPERA